MIHQIHSKILSHRTGIAWGIMLLGCFLAYPALNAGMQGDVALYQGIADDLIRGVLPYRDRVLEYPPYAVPIFMLPRLFGSETYLEAFMALTLGADLALKGLLFWLGFRARNGLASFLPLLYCTFSMTFLNGIYFQRFDVWPALLGVLAMVFFCSQRYQLSGLALALGIGVKLYPVVFLPPLLILAFRERAAKRFILGLGAGILPLLLLGFFLPWWRFAEFQAARGLQVESLYAATLWLAKILGWAQLNWEYTNKWFEVRGAAATLTLPWARGVFVAANAGATIFVTYVALHCGRLSVPRLARLLLLPLLAFVAFNQVLSPQYLIWILPVAALGILEGNLWPMVLLAGAATLTPIIYPSLTGNYFHGLNELETVLLLARNLALVVAGGLLVWEWLLVVPVFGFPRILERYPLPQLGRFFKFCVVGGSGVVIDMAVLHVLVSGCGWPAGPAKLCSAELALLNNFLWNETWTFRKTARSGPGAGRVRNRLLKFHMICGVGIGFAVLLLHVFYVWLGLNLYAANLLAICLATIWNFTMNAIYNWRVAADARSQMPDPVRQ